MRMVLQRLFDNMPQPVTQRNLEKSHWVDGGPPGQCQNSKWKQIMTMTKAKQEVMWRILEADARITKKAFDDITKC